MKPSRRELAAQLLDRIRASRRSPDPPKPISVTAEPDGSLRDPLAPAERIREAIAARGTSLAQLAREAEVSYASVHGFFHGKQDIHLRVASRLCGVLGLELTSKSPRADELEEPNRSLREA